MIKTLSHVLAQILIFIITGIRPFLGPAECRYLVGCTDYTLEQFRTQTILKACWHSGKRILSCNPLRSTGKN